MNNGNLVKAGRPLIDLTKLCHRANRPLLISGSHGIGKSELLETAAKEMNIGYICRDLSLMEPPDLIGLPEKHGKATRYLPPDFLPVAGRGLLVFEELNRCERYMRGPCLQLLTARCLNDYRLPVGWLPVAAINPEDSGYEVSPLDAAMISRFVSATAVADREEWLNWARQNGVHHAVVGYVDKDTTSLDQSDPNPRAYTYASEILIAFERHKSEPQTAMVALEGVLGRVRAAGLWKFMEGADQGLSPAEILKEYPRHQPRVQSWISDGRLDLVQASLDQLMKKFQVSSEFERLRKSTKQWSNFGAFLGDLPGDLRGKALGFCKEWGYSVPKLPKSRKGK